MINFKEEKFTVDGIEFGIPDSCIGLVDEENECYGIAHICRETIDKWTATELMEETLNGECEYEGVISAVKIFAAFDMDYEEVDFTDDDVFQDFGGELYADIMELENYIDNDEENYAYDTHPQIKYRSKDVLSYYWLDCHDDVEFYNYVLVCRMSNVSTENGTYAIYGEFLLPQENWKEELRYLLSRITCGGRPAMDEKELR